MIIKYRTKEVNQFKIINFKQEKVTKWDIVKEIVKENRMNSTPFPFELIITNANTNDEYIDYNCFFNDGDEIIYKKSPPRSGMCSYQDLIKNPNLLQVKVYFYNIFTKNRPLNKDKPNDIINKTEDDRIKEEINKVFEPSSFNKVEGLMNPNRIKTKVIPPDGAVPPKSYICKRCRKPGHYVYRCPYGDTDVSFANNKLVGIPVKNLEIIDNPETLAAELSINIIILIVLLIYNFDNIFIFK